MIGGEDDVVAHLDPIFRTIAPGRRLRAAHARAHRRAVDRRERLPALRAQRRRPLREDGPQRHRVRDHGRVRRGPEHPAQRRRRARRSARPTPRPRRSRDPSTTSTTSTSRGRRGVAARQRRRPAGCSTSPRTRCRRTPTSPTSTAACPTPARAAGHPSPPIDEGVPADVLTTALYARFTSRDAAPTSPTGCSPRCARSSAATTRKPRELGRRGRGAARRRRPSPARRPSVVAERARAAVGRARPVHLRGQRRPHAVGDVRASWRRGRCRGTRSPSTRWTSASRRPATPTGTSRTCWRACRRRRTPTCTRCRSRRAGPRRGGGRVRRARCPSASTSIHLGLGPDGHTASLVPGDPVLDVTDRDVAVTGEYQGRRRMTLTYPVLDRAAQILWLVTGEDKVDALGVCGRATARSPAAASKRPAHSSSQTRPRRRTAES